MPLLEALDRVGCGGLALSTEGDIKSINRNARRILQFELSLCEAQAASLLEGGRAPLKQLLSRAQGDFRLDNENWALIKRADTRPLVLQAMQISDAEVTGVHTVLILLDLNEAPQPSQTKLEGIFGLTPAEARLAVLLTGGATPAEAAGVQGITLATVRTQLSAIYAKTYTHRQAELVTLMARLSVLP